MYIIYVEIFEWEKRFQMTSWSALMPFVFLLIDYVVIVSSEQLAYLLRNFLFSNSGALYISWLNFWVTFPALYLIFISINQPYNRRTPFVKVIENIFYASMHAIIAIIIVLYAAQIASFTSRLFIALFWGISFIFLGLFRFVIKKVFYGVGFMQIPILIVGAGKTAEAFVKSVNNDVGMGYKIIGLLEDTKVEKGVLEKYPVLGGFEDIEIIVKETGVKHVIITAPGLEQDKLTKLIYRVQTLVKNVCVIPNLIGASVNNLEVESLFDAHLILIRLKNNLERPLNRFLKILFDYVLTIMGTILISPVLLLIAVWIYFDSPGKVIFKHKRIGKNGKEFFCYKFRSMCVDAEEKLAELLANDSEARAEWERDFKLKNDPRITSSGAFLRKTSLDELPQIFNVLKGEMSLVGPRPIIQKELERYGTYVNDYLMVKPGITGMWQVSGRSDIDYEERVVLDSWYVRNWNIWLDIMLLWRTVKVVVKGKGAY